MRLHFDSYLKIIEEVSPGISPAIRATVDSLIPKYIQTFSFREHVTGLLLGNVQSGKTSHVFGIVSSAADEGFQIFIFLTADNTYLHEQTLKRAINCFDTFNVCSEDDELRFLESRMRKPAVIVLKKNTKVLLRWKNNIASSKYCEGRAIFIVDDEGDAASLNTKVNKQEQSTINSHLEGIKRLANSSLYLQVTATPQSLLLQSKLSTWRPSFVYYFPPGQKYLGGDFFYNDPPSPSIRLTKENELDDLMRDESHISDGLRMSLLTFLVVSAHIMLKTRLEACNFLVHPSVRIAVHEKVATKIGSYLNQMLIAIQEEQMDSFIKDAWDDLTKTKRSLIQFHEACAFIKEALHDRKIKIYVMNSTGNNVIDYYKGINIIIGGNSLGRGVTFPALQTVYYCRTAKVPQADTFWQHCRMFGYDRDPDLMRVFIPPSLLKLFIELNNSNRALLGQVINHNPDDISLLYPPGIRPSRLNVINKNLLDIIVGGVNRFPNFPKRKFVKQLDEALAIYDGTELHEITLNKAINILELFESEYKDDWSNIAFINCIKALKASRAENKAFLIVRRGRSISKGTGTLLSPDDRTIGDSIKKYTVLTLYRITGECEKGWDGHPFWIPNIKLPEGKNFWKVYR